MQAQTYKTVTIKIPQINFQQELRKFFLFFSSHASNFVSLLRSQSLAFFSELAINKKTNQLPPRSRNLNFKKVLPLVILVITVGLTTIVIGNLLSRVKSNNSSDNRIVVAGAKASTPLSNEFAFPLTDIKGNKITEVKFALDSAELRDEIIVKGKRATAIQGRTFLILSLKITNDYTKALEINSKDYFRLTVNGNEKDLLAPDIHNDPVIVQPMSTKFTRVGWPVNDSDKNFVLQVGEIEGKKTKIDLVL